MNFAGRNGAKELVYDEAENYQKILNMNDSTTKSQGLADPNDPSTKIEIENFGQDLKHDANHPDSIVELEIYNK